MNTPWRGQAVVGHLRGRGRDDRRQRPLIHARILGPHGFLPEELAGIVVEPAADFRADLLPFLRLGPHQFRLDHFAHHFQVLGRADAAHARARAWCGGPSRKLLCFHLEFNTAPGQAGEEQFQLRGVQLLALLAEEAAGQRVELLAQQGVLTAQLLVGLLRLLERLLQRRKLRLQRVDLFLQRAGVHLIAISDDNARGAFKLC